ncbi:FAD-dependent monooxygenase [Nocardia sp. NPDC003345]
MDNCDSDNDTVVVVGGGIGGLAAALGLVRTGKKAVVLEQATEFGEIGAGLQLGPNATRILASWGLLEQVKAVGVLPGGIAMRDAVSGEEIGRLPLTGEFLTRFGAPYAVIHRTDLHAILLEACREAGVELHTKVRVERVENTGTGTVTVADDGRTFPAAATIAADGLNSALRATIVGDELVPSGYVAYRGTVPITEVPARDRELDDVVVWVGPGCHLVQYRLRAGEVLNQVAVFESPAFRRGEQEFGGVDELDAAFADCHPHVRDAIAYVGKQRRWPLYDREPAEDWGSGRLMLTGDAAHPMLQYLAQGCCQALEDAKTLELFLTETSGGTDWPAVLEQFSRTRRPRTAEVQTKARLFGEICHARGAHRFVRNALLATLEPADLCDHADWIYRGPVFDLLRSPRLTTV